MGFFVQSELVQSKEPMPTIAQCGACGLLKKCNSPKMKPSGSGRRVLIVAESPGKTEDETGKPMSGSAGHELRSILTSLDIDLDRDCTKTNAIICHPAKRAPTDKELIYCRPYLTKVIDIVKPEVIIPLGARAVKSVLMGIWKSDVGEMARWAGTRIPEQSTNTWICPTWHPGILAKAKDPVMRAQLVAHLQVAFALPGRPWAEVPDWQSEIRLIKDHRAAAGILDKMTEAGGHVAFDFECNTLRPENEGAKIISCSVCWRGQRTIAYPWVGEAIAATGRLLSSPCPKVGWNIKFEDRWVKHEFGHPTRNWAFDGQIGVHCESSRRKSKSLDFQAFTKLGLPPYDKHISSFLKSKGSSPINRIVEDIGLDDLLLYNGMDSLLEYKLGYDTAHKFGFVKDWPRY